MSKTHTLKKRTKRQKSVKKKADIYKKEKKKKRLKSEQGTPNQKPRVKWGSSDVLTDPVPHVATCKIKLTVLMLLMKSLQINNIKFLVREYDLCVKKLYWRATSCLSIYDQSPLVIVCYKTVNNNQTLRF